jgi:hypothetical protein
MSCTAAAAVELPEEVWTQILQHVDYKQRLSACALVCQKLAKAAAAATTSVTLQLYSDSSQRHNSFLSYTRSYGSSLTRLHLSSSPDHAPIRQLPCPHLLELELNFCSVQLCAGSEGLGLLHSCPALTRLVLRAPTLLDGSVAGPAGAAPSAVAQLQSFALEGCDRPGEADHDSRAAQALQDRLLPHLTSLTHLSIQAASTSVDQYLNTVGASLPNEPVQSCFLQHISSMVRLKQLSMKHGNGEGRGRSISGRADRLLYCLVIQCRLQLVWSANASSC